MSATVKGWTPEQMNKTNEHRPYHIRAVGLTFWSKMQIVAGVLLGAGTTIIGLCMLYSISSGVPQ